MSLKIVLGLVLCAVVAVQCQNNTYSIQSVAVPLPVTERQTRANVIQSNLPIGDQNVLASALQSIYNTVSDPVARATRFQNYLQQYYPSKLNNVVIGYKAVAYFQTYFIIIYVNGDYVIAFGIQC